MVIRAGPGQIANIRDVPDGSGTVGNYAGRLACCPWPISIDFYGKVYQNRQFSRGKMQALCLCSTAGATRYVHLNGQSSTFRSGESTHLLYRVSMIPASTPDKLVML